MRILLIDDNDTVRLTLGAILEDSGHVVVEAESLATGRERLAPDFQLVLLDVHLGDGLGPSLIPEVRAAIPGVKIALLTGEPGDPQGADLVLEKGADPMGLLQEMERLVARP